MISATAAGVTTSYAVNGFGERIRKTGAEVPNGAANEYVYAERVILSASTTRPAASPTRPSISPTPRLPFSAVPAAQPSTP
jgi:hypothetical protein